MSEISEVSRPSIEKRQLSTREIVEKLVNNLAEWSELLKKPAYTENGITETVDLPDSLSDILSYLVNVADKADDIKRHELDEENRKKRIAKLENDINKASKDLSVYPSLQPYLQALYQKFNYPRHERSFSEVVNHIGPRR